MSAKLKAAVIAALNRNTFTADQPIEVYARGRHVFLMGSVEREDLIYEAIATAETVSPLIVVHNRLLVRAKVAQLETAPVL
jgi:osmotically-inducible protein OsmY